MALKLQDEAPVELPPPIGDNSRAAAIAELLQEKYPKLASEARELLDRRAMLPDPIQTDANQKLVADYIVDLRTFEEKLDSFFRNEKAPWLIGGRGVDNFFGEVREPVEHAIEELTARTGEYLEAKKQREEQRLREQRQKAEREANERAAAARMAEEEAEAARRKAIDRVAEKSGISKRAAAVRVDAAPPKAVERKLDVASDLRLQATQADRRVDHVIAKAAAPASHRVRTRGSQSMATLSEEWTFEIVDIDKIPLQVLRPYITRDAIEVAIKGLIKTGRRELAGVRIFKKPKANIRR